MHSLAKKKKKNVEMRKTNRVLKPKQLSNILTLQPTKDLLNQSFLVLGFFLSKNFFFTSAFRRSASSASALSLSSLGLNTVKDNTLLDYGLQFTISSKLMLTQKSKILIWPGISDNDKKNLAGFLAAFLIMAL